MLSVCMSSQKPAEPAGMCLSPGTFSTQRFSEVPFLWNPLVSHRVIALTPLGESLAPSAAVCGLWRVRLTLMLERDPDVHCVG